MRQHHSRWCPARNLEKTRSNVRIVHPEGDVKSWVSSPPSCESARPGRCASCGAASRPAGEPLGLVGHGLRERLVLGPTTFGELPKETIPVPTVSCRRHGRAKRGRPTAPVRGLRDHARAREVGRPAAPGLAGSPRGQPVRSRGRVGGGWVGLTGTVGVSSDGHVSRASDAPRAHTSGARETGARLRRIVRATNDGGRSSSMRLRARLTRRRDGHRGCDGLVRRSTIRPHVRTSARLRRRGTSARRRP